MSAGLNYPRLSQNESSMVPVAIRSSSYGEYPSNTRDQGEISLYGVR